MLPRIPSQGYLFSTTRIPSTPDTGHSTRQTYCSLSLRQDESPSESPLLALWKRWTPRESARIGHYQVSSYTTMVAKSPLWWWLYFIGSRNSSAQNFRIAWFRSPVNVGIHKTSSDRGRHRLQLNLKMAERTGSSNNSATVSDNNVISNVNIGPISRYNIWPAPYCDDGQQVIYR